MLSYVVCQNLQSQNTRLVDVKKGLHKLSKSNLQCKKNTINTFNENVLGSKDTSITENITATIIRLSRLKKKLCQNFLELCRKHRTIYFLKV